MFEDLSPTRYERLLRHGFFPSCDGSILSGISRKLRLSYHGCSKVEQVAISTAADVIAPMCFLFVWWVLHRAKRDGIKRLYFLARDGELLFKVACILIENWQLDIEARYLYCSRESLLLPSFQHAGSFEIDWITWGYTGNITWEEICARVGLTCDEASLFVERSGLSDLLANPQRKIEAVDRDRIVTLLQREDFSQLVRDRVQSRYEQTRNYLFQEGMMDNVPFALVDTGWRGSSQYALSALLAKGEERPVQGLIGYYLGLNRHACCYDGDQLNAFLFDWRTGKRDDQLYNFICFEMLCSAEHGRTIGYRKMGERIAPILGQDLSFMVAPLARHHHRVAVDYSRLATQKLSFLSLRADVAAQTVRQLARTFICQPDLEQAEVYGEWPMASEMREGDSQPTAPIMGLKRFFRCVIGLEKVRGFWPQASLLRGKLKRLVGVYNLFLSSGLLDKYRRFVLRY